ncbi:MAG: hypothetical protein ACO1N0_17745 [Fluviicola sp.]
MKQAIKLFSLLLIIALSTGCKKKTIGLNEEFELDFSKTVTVKADGKKFKIRFAKLVEETRCAPDVECIWAGEVAVRIELDHTELHDIGFHSQYPSSIVYKDRTIKLLEVNYKDGSYNKEEDYSIRLKVE